MHRLTVLLDAAEDAAPDQRLLVEGDMGDQIKDIEFSAIGHGLLQNVQRHAVFGQLFQHRLLALGGVPAAQEIAEAAEL